MTYQIVDWLISYIECFVMLVVVTESGGRKFEEKKQAYLLLSFSLLNAILVAVCNQISAFSFITPVLSILYLTVISKQFLDLTLCNSANGGKACIYGLFRHLLYGRTIRI